MVLPDLQKIDKHCLKTIKQTKNCLRMGRKKKVIQLLFWDVRTAQVNYNLISYVSHRHKILKNILWPNKIQSQEWKYNSRLENLLKSTD